MKIKKLFLNNKITQFTFFVWNVNVNVENHFEKNKLFVLAD